MMTVLGSTECKVSVPKTSAGDVSDSQVPYIVPSPSLRGLHLQNTAASYVSIAEFPYCFLICSFLSAKFRKQLASFLLSVGNKPRLGLSVGTGSSPRSNGQPI